MWAQAGSMVKLTAAAKEVTGRDFERGQHKRTSDGMVTPGQVASWIESRIDSAGVLVRKSLT